MPWNDETKTASRIWKFVDQYKAGENALRSAFDMSLDDANQTTQDMHDSLSGRVETVDGRADALETSVTDIGNTTTLLSSEAEAERKRRSIDSIQDSIYRIRDHQLAFFSRLDAGEIGATYPGVYTGPSFARPEDDASYIAKRDIVINRLRQMAAVEWTPLVDMRGEDEPNGVQFPGPSEANPNPDPVQGPPYSSVKTLGRSIGHDILLETFVTATQNPDADFYPKEVSEGVFEDFTDLPNWPGVKDAAGNITDKKGCGVLLYGAVCSNFIAYGFNWFYPPVTGHLDTDYLQFGFVARSGPGSFDSSSLKIGDVLNSAGGGHIEIVIDRDDEAQTITLFDQDTDGPQPTVLSTDTSNGIDEATAKIQRKNYALLIYDYSAVTHSYTPDPYSPLPEESLATPSYPDFVKLNKGNKANYFPGETVRFNLSNDGMDSLVVSGPSGNDTITTTGDEIVTEDYSETGDYTAQCYLSGSPVGQPVQFKVASITGSLSASTIPQGDRVTVSFVAENCVPNALLVETQTTLSITPGILREITPEEIAAGQISFDADLSKRGWHVRIRGTNAFGAVFNEPIDGLTLEVE